MTAYFERGDLVRFALAGHVFKGRILSLDTTAQTFCIRCMDSTTQDMRVNLVVKIIPPVVKR